MPFNGSGSWSYVYSWVNDANNGIPITASRMDAQFNDIGNNGLDNCITRDGQGGASANIPMNTHKLTGLAVATTSGDALSYAQPAVIQGTATNDNVATGMVGEYVSSASGSPVSLTTATPANVTSISLTAGDWDVRGGISFSNSATVTAFVGGISSTSATFPASSPNSSFLIGGSFTASQNFPLNTTRFSLSGTTTIYLVSEANFSGGSVTTSGSIEARRAR